MKHTISIFLLFLLLVANTSCQKRSTPPPDYFFAGHVGGFIGLAGPTKFYLVSNGELRKDTTAYHGVFPDDISKYNFNVLLDQASYSKVADLPASIPSELLHNNNATYGTTFPDAGTLLVRARIGGYTLKWTFEIDQSKSSKEIQDFVTRINQQFN